MNELIWVSTNRQFSILHFLLNEVMFRRSPSQLHVACLFTMTVEVLHRFFFQFWEKNMVLYWFHTSNTKKHWEILREKCISICLFYISIRTDGRTKDGKNIIIFISKKKLRIQSSWDQIDEQASDTHVVFSRSSSVFAANFTHYDDNPSKK